MFISNLKLSNFRNYHSEVFDFSPNINLIVGLNGQGKSNLLEAIYFASLGHSPYSHRNKELISWSQDSFLVTLLGKNNRKTHSQSVQLDRNGKKQIRIDGNKGKSFSELLGNFPIVLFYIEDILLVQGGPSVRRKFLNVLLSQMNAFYLKALKNYQIILKQKNMLLNNFAHYSKDVLKVLNLQLVQSGLELVKYRQEKIKILKEQSQYFYHFISDGKEILEMEYNSHWKDLNEFEILKILEEKERKEIEMKVSLNGPHRDNLLLLLDDKVASDYASQGQKRLIALSLKLASSSLLQECLKKVPIFLLDDAFAELDEHRRLKLSQVMSKNNQIFLASPRQKDIPFNTDKIIEIEGGTHRCL